MDSNSEIKSFRELQCLSRSLETTYNVNGYFQLTYAIVPDIYEFTNYPSPPRLDGKLDFRDFSDEQYEKSQLFQLIIHEEYTTSKTNADLAAIISETLRAGGNTGVPEIHFRKDDHIWNMAQLRIEIEKHCNPSQIKAIRDHLFESYGSVMSLPSFDQILVPYEIAFEKQLMADKASPFQLNNPFFGRGEDIESMSKFFAGENQKMICIVGDGGFGKTRLCLEAFVRFNGQNPGAELFVIDYRAFKTQLFSDQVNSKKNVFVLMDDADKHVNLFADVVATIGRMKNVKLIVTIRKAVYDETMRLLPTQERNIPSIPLKRLGYEDTRSIIQSQLPGIEEDYLVRIADQSRGVPLVILGLCQTILGGRYSHEFSEQENFILFVREVRDQLIEDVSSKYVIAKEKVADVIHLLSILGPLRNEANELAILAECGSVSTDEVTLIVNALAEYDFIILGTEISIIPDVYSGNSAQCDHFISRQTDHLKLLHNLV